MRTGNIRGIQGGRQPETGESPKPTVVHRSSGGDQQESEYEGHSLQVDIRLDGKKLNQRDSFVYLGGAVCGDASTETEIRRKIQAGASALRKVEGDGR